jgi:N-acetylmuramoyl-L-alanine amidase
MKEKLYIVQEGDWLSSIAKQFGIGEWKKIYDHPKNRSFKKKYPDPNVLNPGEELWLPEPDWLEIEPKRIKTDVYKFVVSGLSMEIIKIVFKDENGNPLANQHYKLRIGGYEKEGITNDDGLLKEEIEPKYFEYGTYSIHINGQHLKCRTGHLDTHDKPKGIQTRLANLGFEVGVIDGKIGPKTRAAVKAFQNDFGLKTDGIAGSKTQTKLKEIYGS